VKRKRFSIAKNHQEGGGFLCYDEVTEGEGGIVLLICREEEKGMRFAVGSESDFIMAITSYYGGGGSRFRRGRRREEEKCNWKKEGQNSIEEW